MAQYLVRQEEVVAEGGGEVKQAEPPPVGRNDQQKT